MKFQWLVLIIQFIVVEYGVFGRIVNFSIITFGNEVTVSYSDKTLNMKPVNEYSHVFSVSGICPEDEFEYTYTVDGKPEDFTRSLPAGQRQTYNEFYGRKETISPMKGLGYPADKPQWTRSIGKTETFDDSYIPTIIIDAGSREYFVNATDTYTIGRFTMVLKNKIFTDTNVPSKSQNRYQDKFQWRVKLNTKINKRSVFKFRANPNDPTFIRQSIYGDMVAAAGNPVHNQIIVRVYLDDGTPIGLYLMIEVTSSKSFIKSQFYGNESTGKVIIPETGLGYPLDCCTGADFIPGGNFTSFTYDEGEDNVRVKYLAEAMHALDVQNEKEVENFSKKWLDLDTFFKALAFEYLTGHWDSYWMYTSNFVMYDAPEESSKGCYKFYFIDQDFDQTFGIGLSDKVNLYGDDFPSQSYKTLVDREWNIQGPESDGPNRAAIDKFLRGGVTTEMFENHLIDIVKHIFNPVALGRRIDEYVRRYKDEIQWDYNIERIHTGYLTDLHEKYVWTMDDFNSNLDSTPTKSIRWGFKQWIEMRAKAVADEFGFEWDKEPLDPPERKLVAAIDNSNEINSSIKDIFLSPTLIIIAILSLMITYLF